MWQVPAFPGAAQILPKGRVTVSAGERVNIRAQTGRGWVTSIRICRMLFVRAASSSRRACDIKSEQMPFIAVEWLVRAGAAHLVARVAACAARHRLPQPLLTHPAQLLFLRVCRSDGGIHKVQRALLLLLRRRCSSKLSPGNLAACICAPSHSHWHCLAVG